MSNFQLSQEKIAEHKINFYETCNKCIASQPSVRKIYKKVEVMKKCNCTGKCMTKTCSCVKAGVVCNSKCHKNVKGSNPNCVNKKGN